MRRALIIIRTNRPDLATFDRYANIPGTETIFCADERAAPVETAGRPKISLTHHTLLAAGLYPHPDCGWQCGDYCYHLTRLARPDYDDYWLVEPDIVIHTPNLAAFFARFANNAADLLAPRLVFNDQSWNWTPVIQATGLPPWRCFFPITRLSGKAVDHVHATRRAHAENPAIATKQAWPNDESLTASALQAAGFICQDLNQPGQICHTGASLNGVALIDPAVLAIQPQDGLIYHPVRPFAPWFAAAKAQLANIAAELDAPPNPARMTSHARQLTRMAQTLLRHPDYTDASVVPSLIAHHLWRTCPQNRAVSSFKHQADETAARLCHARLQTRFGVTLERKQIATAHIANTVFPLGHFPRGAAGPSVWDHQTDELVLPLSLDPTQPDPTPITVRVPRSEAARIVGVGKERASF